MKTLAIFGATGSVGTSTLKVLDKNKNKFNLYCLSSHTNFKTLDRLTKKYKPKFSLLTSNIVCKNTNSKILNSETFFKKVKNKIDFSVSGVSSYEALDFNLKLTKISKNILIANKETIICGGNFFINEAKKNNCKIIPIDSEHFCLDFFFKNFTNYKKDIKKIYITASGGPFFKKKIKNIRINDVLNHPTWKMGKNISVNSSNMTNKVLELLEAKILFDLPSHILKIKIEDKSMVHSIIALKNNIHFPILHPPNMEIPISASLGLKNNYNLKLNKFSISISEPDAKQFPIIKLGYKLLRNNNHFEMICFTVINERLVNLYLDNKLKYEDIVVNLLKIFKSNKIKILLKKINNTKNSIFKIKKMIYLASTIKI